MNPDIDDAFDDFDPEDEEDEDDFADESFFDDVEDGPFFADPGGRSALRAASEHNPRDRPCPSCERPNRLTPLDESLGYQCDSCADRAERGVD